MGQFSMEITCPTGSLLGANQQLTSQIEKASVFNLVRASLALKSSAKEPIERWGAAPMEIALRRAEAELDQTLQQLPGDIHLDVRTRDQVTKALPAIAGVSLIGASVAAIPAVLTFTTAVPASRGLQILRITSIVPFVSVAAVPVLAFGAVGIGVAALAGSQSLEFAREKARAKLRDRLHSEAERQIFGIGQKPSVRCILSDIQAAVAKAGQNKIEGMT